MKKIKIKENVGDFVKVIFDDNLHTYARIINRGFLAFYDFKTNKEADINEIVSKPILFKIVVTSDAVETGRWTVIGNMPLEANLKEVPMTYVEEIGYPGTYTIFHELDSRRATKEECKNLEYATIWTPDFVEERLRDYYSGRPNIVLERHKLNY